MDVETYCYGYTCEMDDFGDMEMDKVHDFLLNIKGVYEVDGPQLHGGIGVLVYASEYDSPEEARQTIMKAIEGLK